VGEDGRAVALDMFIEPDAGAGLGHDRCERGLAYLKRSRRTIMRKPSSLISWIQSGPDGGRSAGDGRQGSINADTRMPGF
jgi:hypothetical protein